MLLALSLAANLGQWERARREGRGSKPVNRHRYELHQIGRELAVFDPATGDLFAVTKTGRVVRINLPNFDVQDVPRRDVFEDLVPSE
jgi:hypothetical protein